jgi:hypothetical protein
LSINSDFSRFPGGELVQKGLQDAARGEVTQESLLVSLAAPRLHWLGIEVASLTGVAQPYEHRLYELLEQTSAMPHADYNALIQLIVSFANSYRSVER